MKATLLENRGTPLERQRFTWRDLVQKPISKLDDDAFTRVRIILMNGIEHEAMRFQHACARMNKALAAAARAGPARRAPPADAGQLAHRRRTSRRSRRRSATSRSRSRSRRRSRSTSPTRTSRRCTASACWRTSITCTATRRCSTGSRARTRTTSCRATPTSSRAGPPSMEHRAPEDDLRKPLRPAQGRAAHPSCTRSPSWRASSRRTTTT